MSWLMVGDPGIEPGVGLPGGVTVRCRTLQHVAPELMHSHQTVSA